MHFNSSSVFVGQLLAMLTMCHRWQNESLFIEAILFHYTQFVRVYYVCSTDLQMAW